MRHAATLSQSNEAFCTVFCKILRFFLGIDRKLRACTNSYCRRVLLSGPGIRTPPGASMRGATAKCWNEGMQIDTETASECGCLLRSWPPRCSPSAAAATRPMNDRSRTAATPVFRTQTTNQTPDPLRSLGQPSPYDLEPVVIALDDPLRVSNTP